MSNKVRIGVIGVGWWAQYGHIPLIKTFEDFEFVGVCSLGDNPEELKERLGAKYGFATVEDLLACDEIDLVLVLTPGPTHAAISRQVIEAGKDVYTEWPLSTSTKESEELLQLANEKGVRTVIGMQRRLAPSARYFHDLLHVQNYVGDMNSVNLRVGIDAFGEELQSVHRWFTAPDSYTNPVTIYAAHFSDLLFTIVDKPQAYQGIVRTNFDTFKVTETHEEIENTHPTEMVAQGVLNNGALFSITLEGGQKHVSGVNLEVTGNRGVLRMTNVRGFQNVDDNTITGIHDYEEHFHALPIPESYRYLKDTGLDNSVQDLGYQYKAYISDKFKGTKCSSTYVAAVDAHHFIDHVLETSKEFYR